MSNFRLQSKKIYLTYSQTGDLTKEELLKNITTLVLQMNNKITSYLIGKEFHQEGGTHFHIVILLKNKPNITNPLVFDIKTERVLHPNLKGLRTKHIYYQKILYSAKGGDFLKSEDLDLKAIEDAYKAKTSFNELLTKLYEIVKVDGYHRALDHFQQNTSPLVFMKECRRVTSILKEAAQIFNRRELITAKYPNSNYKRIRSLEVAIEKEMSYWLAGPTGLRKTQKLKAELVARNKSAFLLKSNETLENQDIQPKDILILDDGVSNIIIKHREHLIQLFDSENRKELLGRYYNRKIPEDVSVFVLSNQSFYSFLKEFGCENDEAIQRRVIDAVISQDLLINVNVNIEGNHNNVIINSNPFIYEESSIPNRRYQYSPEGASSNPPKA